MIHQTRGCVRSLPRPCSLAEPMVCHPGHIRSPGRPDPYPPEFRRRAVELARLREQPIAHIAADLGIAGSCLHRWLRQADIDEGHKEGLTSDEQAELVRLRRANRTLEMENEILKRAGVNSTGQRNTITIRGGVEWRNWVGRGCRMSYGGNYGGCGRRESHSVRSHGRSDIRPDRSSRSSNRPADTCRRRGGAAQGH